MSPTAGFGQHALGGLMRFHLFLWLLPLVAGCETPTYPDVAESQPHARLRVMSGSGMPASAYLVDCAHPSEKGLLGEFDPLAALRAGKPHPTKKIGIPDTKYATIGEFEYSIPADRVIGVSFNGAKDLGGLVVACHGTVYFTPASGADYQVIFRSTSIGRGPNEECSLEAMQIVPSNGRNAATVPVPWARSCPAAAAK